MQKYTFFAFPRNFFAKTSGFPEIFFAKTSGFPEIFLAEMSGFPEICLGACNGKYWGAALSDFFITAAVVGVSDATVRRVAPISGLPSMRAYLR